MVDWQYYKIELALAIRPRAMHDQCLEYPKWTVGIDSGWNRYPKHEDVKRAVDRDVVFLVYDEGCLWVLNEMRKAGYLPPECKFKVSAHCGHGNPCAAKLLENIGANSVNPVRDIQLQMLASMRQAVDIPLDVHTENPASSGGFIRHYEVPEMIRIAAPIYLKTGGSVAKTHSWETNETDARKRAKQVLLVKRVIDTYYPEAVGSVSGSLEY